MSDTIVIKYTTVAGAIPAPSELEVGELAANVTDKKLYTKDQTGTVVLLLEG